MKNIGTKTDLISTLPAEEFNSLNSELKNTIVDTGQTLETGTPTNKQIQIASAIYASGGEFYTDSGSANAYALDVVGSKQSPHAYFDGMLVRFRPTNANSGASTVNVNSLGIKSIVYQDGTTALASGSLVTTHDALLRYNSAVGKFILLNNNLNDLLDVDTTGSTTGSTLEKNGSGVWVAVNGVPLPTGFINGFTCENASGDTDHDITVSTGKARDALDTFNISSTSPITKQIDANWTDGTNNGGFPSSITLTADTWYHFFIISKPDGTANAGFDSSLTATNLLDGSNAGGAGYTKYRRVASVLTDGSSNIINGVWWENGDGSVTFKYLSTILDFTGTAPVGTAGNLSLSVPIGIIVEAIITIGIVSENSAGVATYRVFENTLTDTTVSVDNADLLVGTTSGTSSGSTIKTVYTDTAGQVFHNSSEATGTQKVITQGYIDPRN